ncbi:MAG: hypothetical protein WA906_11195 [Pacificimonas sp.]
MSVMQPIDAEGAIALDFASDTAVDLLATLHDAMTIARPGQDAAMFADDLRRLADGAAWIAQEMEAMLDVKETADPAPAVEDVFPKQAVAS